MSNRAIAAGVLLRFSGLGDDTQATRTGPQWSSSQLSASPALMTSMTERPLPPNKPLQLTGPAPALGLSGFGRAGPAAERPRR